MSTFRVQTEELVSASTTVSRSITELDAAGAAVSGAAGAGAGTPAAAAYEALTGDAMRTVKTMQTAVEGLSRTLGQAASNYVASDQSATACYLPGGAR
jgi:uncharacterized protein YukE